MGVEKAARLQCKHLTQAGRVCRAVVTPFAKEDGLCSKHWNYEFGHWFTSPSAGCSECGFNQRRCKSIADYYKYKCPSPHHIKLEQLGREVRAAREAAAREEDARRAPVKRRRRVVRRTVRTARPGYVYLVRFGSFYKIGVSRDPAQRIRTFASVRLPFNFEHIHSIKARDSFGAERSLHNRFQSKRVNGEWFDLSRRDVSYIRSLSVL